MPSAMAAPRVPVLKLSMNRTVDRSSGTVVPPDVTSATRNPCTRRSARPFHAHQPHTYARNDHVLHEATHVHIAVRHLRRGGRPRRPFPM